MTPLASPRVGFAPALLFLTALATPIAAQAPSAPGWLEPVRATVAEHLKKPGAVGFSVSIAQKGEILLADGFGMADLEHGAKATATTPFRIGSITKQFTSALVMRLVEQKKIALDDGIERYVDSLPLQGKRVTVQMLLDHTSGIPSYTDLGEEWQKLWPIELTHEQLLGLVAGKPFDFEPGADWHYNNTGYYLLGMLLEKVHGKPFAEIVQSELAAPLGLLHTRYDHHRDIVPGRAQGYAFVDGSLQNDEHLGMSQPGAAGGLMSTGLDLVRWSMALAGGKVVEPASYARMTTPTVLPSGRDTGYGFGLMTAKVLDRKAIGHGGGIHGFNSYLVHLTAADLHIAVVSNGERVSSERLAIDIARTVLGIKAFVPKDLPVPADLADKLVGDYELDIGMVLAITKKGDRLEAQGKAEGQGKFGLKWQGDLEFRADFDADMKLVFTADGKGVTLHQRGGQFVGKRL